MPGEVEPDQLVDSLVKSALTLPEGEREAHLRAACSDPLLLREVIRRINDARAAWLTSGSLLADRFRILRTLGQGGMGVVYEAMDERLNRRVALKCAKPGHQSSLPPEVRHASEVSHYNVCKVHDIHTASTPVGEMAFLSMEYIEGETLASLIKRSGPLDPALVRDIAFQICAGLGRA